MLPGYSLDVSSLYLCLVIGILVAKMICFVSYCLVILSWDRGISPIYHAMHPKYILSNPMLMLKSFQVLVLLLLTSGRDPGIIPRNAHPPEPEGLDSNLDVGAGQTPQLRLPHFKEVEVNGIPIKVKYCDTCMLYRPPRCSHCSICNNCVERFDHHYPWVGQCIGLVCWIFCLLVLFYSFFFFVWRMFWGKSSLIPLLSVTEMVLSQLWTCWNCCLCWENYHVL